VFNGCESHSMSMSGNPWACKMQKDADVLSESVEHTQHTHSLFSLTVMRAGSPPSRPRCWTIAHLWCRTVDLTVFGGRGGGWMALLGILFSTPTRRPGRIGSGINTVDRRTLPHRRLARLHQAKIFVVQSTS
jgi:hypothetical protein